MLLIFCSLGRGQRGCQRRYRHQKVSLPSRIGTKQEMGHQHDEHGQDRHGASCGPYQHQDQARHEDGGGQIECAPCPIAHAPDRYDRGVDEVDQRHVDVENVAILYRAHLKLAGDEVENRGIADQGPVQRAPKQPTRGNCERQVEKGC